MPASSSHSMPRCGATASWPRTTPMSRCDVRLRASAVSNRHLAPTVTVARHRRSATNRLTASRAASHRPLGERSAQPSSGPRFDPCRAPPRDMTRRCRCPLVVLAANRCGARGVCGSDRGPPPVSSTPLVRVAGTHIDLEVASVDGFYGPRRARTCVGPRSTGRPPSGPGRGFLALRRQHELDHLDGKLS